MKNTHVVWLFRIRIGLHKWKLCVTLIFMMVSWKILWILEVILQISTTITKFESDLFTSQNVKDLNTHFMLYNKRNSYIWRNMFRYYYVLLNFTVSHVIIWNCNKNHSAICSCVTSCDCRLTFLRERKHFCIISSTIPSTLFTMEHAQFPTNMNRTTHRTWRDVNCAIITWNPAEVMTTWHDEILTLSLSGSGSGQVLLLHGRGNKW